MRPLASLTAVLLGLAIAAPASGQVTTQTLTGTITGERTLDASEVYLIDGELYVDNGATLTIPAGTVLKGKQTPSAGNGKASVLVVQRGGMLIADGTADDPIIFTAEGDDVTDAFDTNEGQRGLWGGVILLGQATNNRGTRNVEGIDANAKTTYGCGDAGFDCDDDDNSGTLRYVSIRHAGFTNEPDAEINGLTLGAVGRGTTIEYVEVFANSDDSFEFFGGTVNARYLIAAFSGDDDLDWDQGYTGKLQFVFSLKDESGDVGRCIEGDGASTPYTATPLSDPVVSNLTCIGSGVGSSPGGSDAGGPALKLRENTLGAIYNSVFTAYQTSNGGIDLEPQPVDGNDQPIGDPAVSTSQNFRDGDLAIENNIFFDFSVGNDAASIVRRDEPVIEATIAAGNRFVSPGLIAVDDGAGDENATSPVFDDARDPDGVLDPRPGQGAAAASGADFTLARLTGDSDDDDDGTDGGFFRTVDYLGAFAPTTEGTWASGWSALASMGYLSDNSAVVNEEAVEARVELTVGPNPTRGLATVRYALDRGQQVRIALYDVLGREVATLADGAVAAGPASVEVDTASLPTGTYVLRLQAESGTLTRTITVVR